MRKFFNIKGVKSIMKIITNSSKLLLLGVVISLSTLSLASSSSHADNRAYHKELSAHNQAEHDAAQNIIKQHRHMDQNTIKQANDEHAQVDKTTKAKLADAKQIKNHQDRERITNKLKDNRDKMHKDVNARKKARLEHSKKLKKHNLKITHDRYASIKNSIRTKHGRTIKPVTKPVVTNQTKTTNQTKMTKKTTTRRRPITSKSQPAKLAQPTNTTTTTTKNRRGYSSKTKSARNN